jgi:hypothetical protein
LMTQQPTTCAVYGARFQTEFFTRRWVKRTCVGSNSIPLGSPLLPPAGTVNCVQTLKAYYFAVSWMWHG